MYDELSKELIKINSDIRSNPYWQPRTKIKHGKEVLDSIDYSTAKAVSLYSNVMKPSGIKAPIDIFMKSSIYKNWPEAFQKLVKILYEEFKDFTADPDKQLIVDLISDIAITSPQETFKVKNPKTGKDLVTLYTPENKLITIDILKNITGNINYDPLKFNVKRKANSQEYKDAWNAVIKQLDSKKFDDETLQQLSAAIEAM